MRLSPRDYRSMLIRPAVLYAASLLTSFIAYGQQSPNPEPVPAQAQPTPCISAPISTPKPQGTTLALKPPTKWQQYLDAQKRALAAKYGVVLPDTPAQSPVTVKPSTQPCPPQAQAALATPAWKLPPDTTATLHCNPTTPSSKDAAHPTTLTLPDPHDFAVPKPGDFEADSVVPDLAAKTPCYLVKVDPKTQKPFVQQQ